MPQKKPAIDYKQLPFEVHYKRIDSIWYEFMHPAGKPPKTWKGYKLISQNQAREFDVTFRCDDPSGGQLIYVLSGQLDEYIPDWLEHMDSDELDPRGTDLSLFKVKDDEIQFVGQADDYDIDDLEDSNIGKRFYEASDFKPDYLVLDAAGSRLKVDNEGYKLTTSGRRSGDSPVVAFSEDEVNETECRGWDWLDVKDELLKVLKGS